MSHDPRAHVGLGRRGFLRGAVAACTAATASAFVPWRSLIAQTAEERRFVALNFEGGWDVLLSGDPRDPARTYGAELNLGTNQLATQYREPFSVTMGGRSVLLGATMRSLQRHCDVATIFRGVNMNTVAHDVGKAYVNSFMPPAKSAVRGDSLGALMSSATRHSDLVVPSISVGMPAYNASLGPDFVPLSLSRVTDVRDLLRPTRPLFDDDVADLLVQFQAESGSCIGSAYPGPRVDQQLSDSRERVRTLFDRRLEAQFDLDALTALKRRYGYPNGTNATDPRVRAAVAWQVLSTEISRTVTVTLQTNLDQHKDWAANHPGRLQAGFDAMAVLLDDLRGDDPNLDHTTVVAFSEFARTPRINGDGGRDHWFASSILVFGGNLRRGVFGETVENTLGLRNVDPVTGRASASGFVVRPEHIGATLAQAAGLDPAPFRVPVLESWIGGAS